jgi:hypothetical protein
VIKCGTGGPCSQIVGVRACCARLKSCLVAMWVAVTCVCARVCVCVWSLNKQGAIFWRNPLREVSISAVPQQKGCILAQPSAVSANSCVCAQIAAG